MRNSFLVEESDMGRGVILGKMLKGEWMQNRGNEISLWVRRKGVGWGCTVPQNKDPGGQFRF